MLLMKYKWKKLEITPFKIKNLFKAPEAKSIHLYHLFSQLCPMKGCWGESAEKYRQEQEPCVGDVSRRIKLGRRIK